MQVATATEPKALKRPPTRKTPQTTTTPKQKLTLYVTAEASKRLGVHATMLGTDRSSLIETLISQNLKRFVVSDRAKPADDEVRHETTAELKSADESEN